MAWGSNRTSSAMVAVAVTRAADRGDQLGPGSRCALLAGSVTSSVLAAAVATWTAR